MWAGENGRCNSRPDQDWGQPAVHSCRKLKFALQSTAALMRRVGCDWDLRRGKVTLQQEIEKGLGSARKVAVIGGSACGFFTAALLARTGCSVEVLERSENLDPTPRTLIVTSHMRTLLGEVGERAVINEIRKFELFTDGRTAQVPLDRPDLIIERSRLIRGLAEQAQSQGAKVSFGNRFVSLESNGNGLRVGVARARDARPIDRNDEEHRDVGEQREAENLERSGNELE